MVTRRDSIKTFAAAAMATALTCRETPARARVERATRGTPSPMIKDVQVLAVQPGNVRLVVVKIITDQDGLYGYGCATFTQGAELVVSAVQLHLKPFLIGRPADRIDDLWQAMYTSSFRRSGPVLNNAISGVDQALWDIKGRQASMPVYQLLGGKCREAVDLYTSVNANNLPQVIERIREGQAAGYRHFRFNLGAGGGREGDATAAARPPHGAHFAPVFERGNIRGILDTFEGIRKNLGDDVEVLNDVRGKITPTQALQLCRDVEQYRPYFLEDPLSPEDLAYYRIIRQQCSTPIAMGELYNSPHEWTPLVTERLIDYIRVHVSQAGGLTPARKIAALGELHGVRTAWHGPGDVSPVGHCANVTLSIASYNFGIQEIPAFSDATREIFKGCPETRNGYGYPNESPGWGVEIDEKAVAKYPFKHENTGTRQADHGRDDLTGLSHI